MTVTYDWVVEQMEAYPDKDGHLDVVFTVHWRCNARDGNLNATSYGSVGVHFDLAGLFTTYDKLTQDQVVGWVKEALGADQVAQIETGLAGQIDDLKNPPVIIPSLPWAQAVE